MNSSPVQFLDERRGITITELAITVPGRTVEFAKILFLQFEQVIGFLPIGNDKFRLMVSERADAASASIFETEDADLVQRISGGLARALKAYKSRT